MKTGLRLRLIQQENKQRFSDYLRITLKLVRVMSQFLNGTKVHRPQKFHTEEDRSMTGRRLDVSSLLCVIVPAGLQQ